jgi:hypothetical protein
MARLKEKPEVTDEILLSPPLRAFLIRRWLEAGKPPIVAGTWSKDGIDHPYLTIVGLGKALARPLKREFLVRVLDFLGRAEWDKETERAFRKELS